MPHSTRHKYTAQVCEGAAQQELRVCGPSLRGGTRGHDTCEISDMVISLDKHINLVYHYLMPTLRSDKVCQEVCHFLSVLQFMYLFIGKMSLRFSEYSVSEISVYYEIRRVVPMLGKDLSTLHFAKA